MAPAKDKHTKVAFDAKTLDALGKSLMLSKVCIATFRSTGFSDLRSEARVLKPKLTIGNLSK